MDVVLDIETNALRNPTKIWVAVCRETTGDVKVFERPDENPQPFLDYAKTVDRWIGHNIIAFDYPVLHSLMPDLRIDPAMVLDTYVVSATVSYKLEGGHSLENWGHRLGLPKIGKNITDFTVYTSELRDRCISDTLINLKLYEYLLKYIQAEMFVKALDTEHQIAWICNDLSNNGFAFDIEKAKTLRAELDKKRQDIDDILVSSFDREITLIKEFSPSLTKEGTLNQKDFRFIPQKGVKDLTFFEPGKKYFVFSVEAFNPGSIKQCIRRLNEAGWKPTEKTKGHIAALKRNARSSTEQLQRFREFGWTLSETNLGTLPVTAPEGATRLAERLILASRISDIDEWLNSVEDRSATNVVKAHGEFRHIGAWTHRMSHRRPNLANISRPFESKKAVLSPVESLKKLYDEQMRSLWIASKGRVLVGTDAVGIQMRIFAHHVNSEELIKTLISGEDIHRLNMKALGDICKSRDNAKTFIYAFLLGAGVAKIAEILQCSLSAALEAKDNFLRYYPGLSFLLNNVIPKDFARGYLIGLDGRPILCDTEHKVLAGYLQSGETIVMKMACIRWRKELQKLGVPFWQVNFVHDEWQTETINMEMAQIISKVQIDSLKQVGKELNLNIPMDGDSKFGTSWSQTH